MTTVTASNGKELKSALSTLNENNEEFAGELHIIRPAKLAEEGVSGVVAEGIYEGAVPNKYDNTTLDYKVRAENGDLYILNSAGSLAKQMKIAEVGDYVQINYKGKTTLTTGKRKGMAVHNFEVFIG